MCFASDRVKPQRELGCIIPEELCRGPLSLLLQFVFWVSRLIRITNTAARNTKRVPFTRLYRQGITTVLPLTACTPKIS